jgi:uncharacterized membrane protein
MNRWLLYNVVLTLAAFAASLWVGWLHPEGLPEKVPIHWGADGKANGWVQREHILPYLMIVPGVMTGFVLLSLALPWLSPEQFSIDRFRNTYNYLMSLLLTFFAYFHGIALAGSLQWDVNMNRVVLGGMFLLFGLLGNVLGKVQRNFFVGIRTPWTLADETVWIRTHRVAAWLWTGGSLIGFVGVMLLPAERSVWWSLAVIVGMALTPVVYSLVLYKRLQRQGKLSAQANPTPEGQP